MKQIWSARLVQTATKYGEHAPAATVCCNACRTCVQTNLLGLGLALFGGGALRLRRFAVRIAKRA